MNACKQIVLILALAAAATMACANHGQGDRAPTAPTSETFDSPIAEGLARHLSITPASQCRPNESCL